ncbi:MULTISPECIES: cobalt-factor II C(20)-methyltransferase [unclassified Methanoregula]|uniref:cobalt-factor II C(20)-methyltransferase n=1 Tax=unclassified Methanoregula TaxID=2649730 RepID=UPI0009D33029|nr:MULTISPECIES: cobalt-factor II C(20)-methyltransferase [unclassified Methanoregula]OPX64743.1 MAG: Uroporphyrinogen-III C-methyltransferase [Methanoregula sp. PtaB.Bin085]OPY35213.1 MAG: Uroporphyrinogen-III C-methyltransferase [Methanoregula sp. PtaU1.Bin006]
MLIGLGLGPGNPELLTLRAVRLLNEADAVFVPGRIARDLVAPYREPVVLDFPMTDDEKQIQQCLEENAKKIVPVAEDGLAVFGILGDPNFFSTFSRLCAVIEKTCPGIEYRTEPGISSITAFAAAAGIPVNEGFMVSDGTLSDTRILLKVRRPKERADQLRSEGYRQFVLVERMFFPDMQVYRDNDLPDTSDYMSVMYARK